MLFLSGWDSGLVFRDGCIIGLSCVLRCPCFPLGISVESPVLEIACLDSRSGLVLGESHRDFSDIVGSLIISTREWRGLVSRVACSGIMVGISGCEFVSFGRRLYSGFSDLPEKYCLLCVRFSLSTSALCLP